MTNTVTCRKCGARNRLKAASGGKTPVCGRCGTALVERVEIPSAVGGEAPLRGAERAKLSNAQVLVLIGVVALALTGMAELLLLMLY